MQFLELEINPEYFTQEREAAAAAAAAAAAQSAATGRARSFYMRRQGSSADTGGTVGGSTAEPEPNPKRSS